jgi:hypothetical protein
MTSPPTDNGDDLRRVLHDAVSDVQPHGSLDDIRSRTEKVDPMTKRWFIPTMAVAAVMAAVVGGAFWLVHDDDAGGGPTGTPTHGTPTPTGESTTPAGVARAVPVYYTGDTAHGKKLYREFQSRDDVCPDPVCMAKAAVKLTLTGEPADSDYGSVWPSTGVAVHGLTATADLITIDLINDAHDRPAGMSQTDAELAVQQLIYSAQAGLGKGRVPVQLLIDGKHTDTVLGVPASEPLAAANPDDVLAPVQIDNPSNGATVSSPVTVSGRAAAFEANVVWEVLVGGDAVVKQGFATAQECCTLSPYSFTLDLEPGTYTLVVHDTDESGEGRPVNQDTKEFTVQ